MNSKLFDATMVLHGDTQKELADYLGIQQPTLSNKKNGRADFTRAEIKAIKARYNLNPDEVDRIFF